MVHSLEVPYVVGFDRSGLGLDHPGLAEPGLHLFCLRPRLADLLIDHANYFDFGPLTRMRRAALCVHHHFHVSVLLASFRVVGSAKLLPWVRPWVDNLASPLPSRFRSLSSTSQTLDFGK